MLDGIVEGLEKIGMVAIERLDRGMFGNLNEKSQRAVVMSFWELLGWDLMLQPVEARNYVRLLNNVAGLTQHGYSDSEAATIIDGVVQKHRIESTLISYFYGFEGTANFIRMLKDSTVREELGGLIKESEREDIRSVIKRIAMVVNIDEDYKNMLLQTFSATKAYADKRALVLDTALYFTGDYFFDSFCRVLKADTVRESVLNFPKGEIVGSLAALYWSAGAKSLTASLNDFEKTFADALADYTSGDDDSRQEMFMRAKTDYSNAKLELLPF